MVLLGEAVVLAVVQHRRPVVVARRDRGAQGDCDLLKAELVCQLFRDRLVSVLVELAAVDVSVLRLDTEYVLRVLLVGDADVDILTQIGHRRSRLLARPQLAAVVQVTGDLDALRLCRLAGVAADLDDVLTERRRDAGEVEPVRALKDRIPVEIRRRSLLNGGVRAVINADRAALGCALLKVVDSDAVAAADDAGGVDTQSAQGVDRRLTDGVGRELGDKCRVHAVVCERDCDVSLAAAEGRLHLIVLEEPVVSVRSEAKHDFAEGNYSCHYARAYFTMSRDCLHRSVISSHFWLSIKSAVTIYDPPHAAMTGLDR